MAAYCANDITGHQVAALIAQGLGRLHHATPASTFWTVWTIPWDVIRAVVHAIGRRLAWIPLVELAWRTEFVVGTIAVIIEAHAGRWPSPIVIAAFLALSYLIPYCRGAGERELAASVRVASARREASLYVADH